MASPDGVGDMDADEGWCFVEEPLAESVIWNRAMVEVLISPSEVSGLLAWAGWEKSIQSEEFFLYS